MRIPDLKARVHGSAIARDTALDWSATKRRNWLRAHIGSLVTDRYDEADVRKAIATRLGCNVNTLYVWLTDTPSNEKSIPGSLVDILRYEEHDYVRTRGQRDS